MNKVTWKYSLLLALIAVNLFLVYGVVSIFAIDRYTLFISMFIDVPLGILSFSIFFLTSLKEKNKTATGTFILVFGMLVGIITALLSPALFYLV